MTQAEKNRQRVKEYRKELRAHNLCRDCKESLDREGCRCVRCHVKFAEGKNSSARVTST
jgi:hypothetical protein